MLATAYPESGVIVISLSLMSAYPTVVTNFFLFSSKYFVVSYEPEMSPPTRTPSKLGPTSVVISNVNLLFVTSISVTTSSVAVYTGILSIGYASSDTIQLAGLLSNKVVFISSSVTAGLPAVIMFGPFTLSPTG